MKTENTLKKIFVWFLLLSFINLTGCYSSELLIPSTYKFDEKSDIKVTTNDTTYNFKGHQYILVNDTLIGVEGNIYKNKDAINESAVRVPVDDIQFVEVEKVDGLKTTLVAVGGAVVLFIVIGLISLANTDWRIQL